MSAPQPPRRRWFQFSLRSLLVLVTALSILFGWFTNRLQRAHRQRDAIQTLRAEGGRVLYADEFDETASVINSAVPAWPAWLRRSLGDDFFRTPYAVVSSEHFLSVTAFKAMGGLSSLKRLDLPYTHFSSINLPYIQHLEQLDQIDLTGNPIDGNDIQALATLLGQPGKSPLKVLKVDFSKDTLAAVCKAPEFKKLQRLCITSHSPSRKIEELRDDLRRAQYRALIGLHITEDRFPMIQEMTCSCFGPCKSLDELKLLQNTLDNLDTWQPTYPPPRYPPPRYPGACMRSVGGVLIDAFDLAGFPDDWDSHGQLLSETGLWRLRFMTEFEYSSLLQRPLTNSDLKRLAEIRRYADVILERTEKLEADIAELRRALPYCQIEY